MDRRILAPGVLSRELWERDDGASYSEAAHELVMAGGRGELPPIPQLAKDESLVLIRRVADPKIFRKYWDSLAEAFGVSFHFATEEEWEDLDAGRARTLIDEGLAQVRQQHLETGVDEPLEPDDPEHRVHFAMIGLVGSHPAFEQVRDYIYSRAAYQRLGTMDELHLQIGVMAGGIKGRHGDAFMSAQAVAWETGRSLGVLYVLGEIPN